MERIPESELNLDITHIEKHSYYFSPDESLRYALDLRDARAEIKRLKGLSDSQAEALDMMERGAL